LKQNRSTKALIALFLVLLIIFIAGIAGKGITLYDVTNVLFMSPIRKIELGLHHIGASIENKKAYFISKNRLLVENEQLKNENKILRERIKLIQSIYDDNIRLNEILNIKKTKKLNSVIANVIGKASAPFQFLIIDKGKEDNIKIGDPVITTDGKEMYLVGTIYSSSETTSKVLMATDPLFFVSVKDNNTGELGIAQGNITNIKVPFKILKPKISEGDIFTTTSLSSIYPKGVIVGHVSKIIQNSSVETTAIIESETDFGHLFEIMIITEK
jgi:rod shape-determining protein MreC